MEKWKTLASGLQLQTTIDAATISLVEKEKKKFRDILHRVLDVILFLARQNLSFRGHREDASSLNKGNFLELVELLSHYDVALREHLVRLQQRTDSQVVCYCIDWRYPRETRKRRTGYSVMSRSKVR